MQTDEKLKKRIAYEKMLASISERAMSVDDLHHFLESSLKSMGSILDVSRIFIFAYQPSSDTFSCICEWVAEGIATLEELDEITLSIPWGSKQLKAGHVINFRDIRDMPGQQYRERLLAADTKSTLNVPLFIQGDFYGFIGFDECRHHRKWIDEDIYILTTATQLITRAIENKKYEEELEQHRSGMESIFSSVQDAIITVDTEMNVIQANKASETFCGFKIQTGQPFSDCARDCDQSCVEVLQETLRKRVPIQDRRTECRRSHAKKMIAMVNSSPLLDGGGNFMGAVLVIRDITRLTRLEEELRERHHFHNIIGKSEKMRKIYSLLKMLANQETTVLITGESGTGKDMAAKALHYAGARASGPFVAVNCSALAESLLESELFGHVKGAFTGAEKDKIGRFEAADGGTILLDEIGDISPLIQLKLLRVLQEKEFERVGESNPKKVDVRVIASTNGNLQEAINMGRFRRDLYYRLNVLEIRMPPLRERYEDIPLLIEHFCGVLKRTYAKDISGVSDEVLQIFMNYPWPGNVRELENVLERGFVFCRNRTIQLEHIPAEISDYVRVNRRFSEKTTADDPEKILKALEKTDWNISKAARFLGITRWTMYRRFQKYNISRPAETL
ncbi:MAG TPA: sigma 54-interacting transcriptional regulator [Sedimentisphaerales bacterium]|nr:sigma 54-interacting transcriptional regulator [Sedimentisphaerales bacterium]HUT71678.1 sigma 54-interacting transcriptional regulator [Desulfatiglandales bacterium]